MARRTLTSELAAMAREAVKDVRGTLHQTYFGRSEPAGEPGAPLNPTMQEVTEQGKSDPDAHLMQYAQAEPEAPAKQMEMERE